MKKIIQVAALAALLSFAFPLGVFADSDSMYCQPYGSYGYHVYVSSNLYSRGQTVEFCFKNNTRTPTTIGESRPWKIIDDKDTVVYEPALGTPGVMPEFGITLYDRWDGRNQAGVTVKPGIYYVDYYVNGVDVKASFKIASRPDRLLDYASFTIPPGAMQSE